MAIQARDFYYISFTFKDDDGAISELGFYVDPDAIGVAGVQAFVPVAWPLAQALSDSQIIEASFRQAFYDDTYPEPALESDVENKAVFLLTSLGNFSAKVSVPGILESKLSTTGIPKGIYLDMGDPDVAAFASLLVGGIDMTPFGFAGWVRPCDSRGADFRNIKEAYKVNRPSHKANRNRG